MHSGRSSNIRGRIEPETVRPPSDMGASLGGFERLRAFPTYRFSDKAALLYAAELRLTSKLGPGQMAPAEVLRRGLGAIRAISGGGAGRR